MDSNHQFFLGNPLFLPRWTTQSIFVFLTKKPLSRYSFKIISSATPAPKPRDLSLVNLANPPSRRKQSLIRHTEGFNEKPPHVHLGSTIPVASMLKIASCLLFHICSSFGSFSSSLMLRVMSPERTILKSSSLQQTQGVSTSLRASSMERSCPPLSPVESMVRFGNLRAMALIQGLLGPSLTTISFLKGYSLNSMKEDSTSSSMSWRLQQVRNTTEMLLFSASEKLYIFVLFSSLAASGRTFVALGEVTEAEEETGTAFGDSTAAGTIGGT